MVQIEGRRSPVHVAQYRGVLSFPKYVLAAHLAEGKRALVVTPSGVEGVEKIVKAGATEVLVVGATHQFPDSVQARADGVPNLPLHDGTVDLVVLGTRALEGSEETLQALLLDLRRVLAPEGRVIAAVQMPGARVFEFELPDVMGPDFWTLESLLNDTFGSSQLFAQMSWQGVALSPVVGDDSSPQTEPEIILDESALQADTEVSHYLMVAGGEKIASVDDAPCLLVAFPEEVLETYRPAASVPTAAVEEISQLRDALGVRAAKNAALQRTLRDLESQVTALRVRPPVQDPAVIERLNQSVDSYRLQLEAAHANYDELTAQHAQLQKSATALRTFSERTSEELAAVTDERAVVKTAAEELQTRASSLENAHEALGYEYERAKSELDVLEKLTIDQENALKESGSREREYRQDWEVARAEVISLRATNEELRDGRDEIRREFDELVAIHRRAEHDMRRSREELRVAVRRASERTREYEARVEEISHLRGRLEDAQRLLHASEEEVFRLKTSQTSARSLSNEGHVLEELERDRGRLRERLAERQVELQALDREALTHRMEVAEMRLEAEQHRREEARLRVELERFREVVRRGQADWKTSSVPADDISRGVGTGVREDEAVASGPEAETEGTKDTWSDAAGDAVRDTPKSWEMALAAIQDGDEKFEGVHAEFQHVQAKLLEREDELTRLQQVNTQAQAELERRRAREATLARMLEEREGGVGEVDGAAANAEEGEQPVKVGADGLPSTWPAEARKMIRRLERKIKFGTVGDAKDQARAESNALEAKVRAVEQAHLLGRLEAASQTIWELKETTTRGDSQLQTRRLELEREREVRQSLLDELEVVRRLLVVEQTRALERERLLADARAEAAGLMGGRAHTDHEVTDPLVEPENFDAMEAAPGLVDLGAHDASMAGAENGGDLN